MRQNSQNIVKLILKQANNNVSISKQMETKKINRHQDTIITYKQWWK